MTCSNLNPKPFFHTSLSCCFEPLGLAVAAAVADINRKVDQGAPENTLQALQAPGAALRGVLSECADAYQTHLAQAQADTAGTGNMGTATSNCVPCLWKIKQILLRYLMKHTR